MFVALERIFLDQYDSSRRNQRPRNICTKLYKKKSYFSILPFPFHILFREQERSFAKRVVTQSLIKLIELNKNPIDIYRNHQGNKETYPQNLKSLVISHRDEGQTRKAT